LSYSIVTNNYLDWSTIVQTMTGLMALSPVEYHPKLLDFFPKDIRVMQRLRRLCVVVHQIIAHCVS